MNDISTALSEARALADEPPNPDLHDVIRAIGGLRRLAETAGVSTSDRGEADAIADDMALGLLERLRGRFGFP